MAVFSVSCVGLGFVYHFARQAQLEAVRGELAAMARTLAVQINGDLHRTLATPEQMGSPVHQQVLAPMVAFHRANPSLFYVYTAVLRDGRIYLITGTDQVMKDPRMVALMGPKLPRAFDGRRMIYGGFKVEVDA